MLDKNQFSQSHTDSLDLPQTWLAKIIIICSELLIALPIGLALAKFHIGGVAWIFGGIVGGALVLNAGNILYKYPANPNKNVRKIGQVLVGLVIGFSIAHGNLAGLYSELPIFAFLTLFILLNGTAIGYFYARISQTNILTAMLATTPGGIGIMSSIAADYEKNVSLVSLVQVIRVTMVVFLIPILARILAGDGGNTAVSILAQNWFSTEPLYLSLLVLSLILTYLGVIIALFLRIPAAFFFGSLIIGITFNYIINWFYFIPDIDFKPPFLMNLLGQALLGISIGEYWGSKPKLNKKTILFALIPVFLTIGVGFVAAEIAMLLTPWDWLTCMLVTAPGGSAEMILVALSLNHNVEIVTAAHLIRLIAIHASLPLWLLLFRYLDRLLPESSNNESEVL